jgi:hypothetical protein
MNAKEIEITEKEKVTVPPKEKKKTFLQIYVWNKIEKWVKKNPKQSYYILMSILFLTFCSAVFNMFYKQENQPNKNKHTKAASVSNNISPVHDAGQLYESQKDKQELESYKQKGNENLTPEELEKAKFILKKYGLIPNSEKQQSQKDQK